MRYVAFIYTVLNITQAIDITRPIEIRGAKYGVDARYRSTTGIGSMAYTGAADVDETTFHGGTSS